MLQAPIYFEKGFQELNQFIENQTDRKFFFLVDENTHEYCLPLLLSELIEIQDIEIIEIPVGEDAKSIEVTTHVWDTLSELGADRHSIIINCGGGVVTDFGGFVASTFKRGIKFINVPTSLLAMVDASVGGKTGINLNHLKNQIGTFAQPEMVLISPEFLETLPQKEMLSGFAEMLKHGLIRDKDLWHRLIKLDILDAHHFSEFIKPCIFIKKDVVTQDPKEKGLRKILNAGHTLGHALETWCLENQQQITHGEAVALGLILESYISWQKNNLPQEDFDEIFEGIQKFYPKVNLPNSEQILPYLRHDKKNEQGKIGFVLLNEMGHCSPEMQQVTTNEISEAFLYYKNLYR